MNRFLSSLIARNLGEAPAIRPRLPSFFEPDRNRAAALPTLSEPEPDASSASLPLNSAPWIQTPNNAPASTGSTSTPLPSRSEPSSDAAQPNRPASFADSVHVVRTEPGAPGTKLGEQQFAPVEKFAGASRVRAANTKQKIVRPAVPAAKSEHAVRVPLFPQRPVQSQHVPPRGHPQASLSGDDLAVNVTIGKVEVRAILPEPSRRPVKTARTSTPLSLDDYLKRRDRGRR